MVAPDFGDGGAGRRVIHTGAVENPAHSPPLFIRQARAATGAGSHERGQRIVVAIEQIEQIALEIARNQNVHARRERVAQRRGRVLVAADQTVQDVVLVGGDDQPLHRQAHRAGEIAGVDVAEVSRGHGEGNRPLRGAEPQRRMEIIDDLHDDARPVDRVHRHQPPPGGQKGLIGEGRLHQALAIIEIAFDRQIVDIVAGHRGHLLALDFRHLAVGMQDADVNPPRMAAALERGRAGVARSRPENERARAAARKHMIEHPAEHLQGEILEGQRRPVEQLEHILVVAEGGQRRHPGLGEAGIAVLYDPAQFVRGEGGAGEWRRDAEGEFGVGEVFQFRQVRGLEAG